MFELPGHWVWDFWVVRDPPVFHLFFLKAPRTLGDPDLRHRHATVGHAVSDDLTSWEYLGEALAPQPSPAYDDLAVWTGCTVRAPGGGALMFTTGLSHADDGQVQRIGVAGSDDLVSWQRDPRPVLEADSRWYAVRDGRLPETHWRDPWVFEADGTWHLVATAMSPATHTAVIAHAVSADLSTWEVLPPLTPPSRRFGWAEVPTILCVEGSWVLVFSCLSDRMLDVAPGSGGVWSVPVPDEALTPAGSATPVVRLDDAQRLTTEHLYAGRPLTTADGTPCFMAFRNTDAAGEFVGGLTDSMRLGWSSDHAGLRLLDEPSPWSPGAQELLRR